MRLTDWQQRLEHYLLDDNPHPEVALRDSLMDSPTLSAEKGLQIYHNAYRQRLVQALRQDYPAVHYWLGDDEFALLVRAYCSAHPPSHFSLRWLGLGFADFIDAWLHPEQSPPLSELARLEWAFSLAFDAAAGTPLSVQEMASLPAAEWPALQVRLLPSVQWLTLRHNSLALWQAARAKAEFPASRQLGQVEHCLIWRQGLLSHYRSLALDEAAALRGMTENGWSFAMLCEQLSAQSAQAPMLAASWLKQWLSEGLLQRV